MRGSYLPDLLCVTGECTFVVLREVNLKEGHSLDLVSNSALKFMEVQPAEG